MGDIGGIAQAAASTADTMINRQTSLEEQSRAQNFDASQAAIARGFNAQQAGIQRNFQREGQLQAEKFDEFMSDTAMSRRVADLKRAGLNPLLAVGNLGGASSPMISAPMGAAGSAGGAPTSPGGLPAGSSLAAGLQGAFTGPLQRDLLASQKVGQDLSNQTKAAELPFAGAQAKATVDQLEAQTNNLLSSAMELSARYNYDQQSAVKLAQDTRFAAQLQPLLMQANALDNLRKQYGLPEMSVQSKFWSSPLAIATYAGQQGHKVASVGGGIIAAGLQVLQDSAVGKALSQAQGTQDSDSLSSNPGPM